MEWAINSSINPVTREQFGEGEAEKWMSLYNQDLATYNARNASNAKEGSIPLTELTEGKIPTRPAVTAGTPKATTTGTKLTPEQRKALIEQITKGK